MLTVNYTGQYPNHCSGKWEINIDGTPVSCTGEMGTKGEYSRWSFGENYSEEWESYEDGDDVDKWVTNPPENLLKGLTEAQIEPTQELLQELYKHIQPLDWRHLSCGGCI